MMNIFVIELLLSLVDFQQSLFYVFNQNHSTVL